MTAAHVIQRPLRGSRISTFYPIKSLPSLSSLDSAFQLQEYISLLIRLDVHDVDSIVSLPGTSKKDGEVTRGQDSAEVGKEEDKDSDRKSDIHVDQACWIYEQLRRLAQDLSHPLITTLQQECSRATCPEMKAGEWLYLCVAHGNGGAMEQCCAIDYILHTVDSATALLNSPRTFPSRLQIPQTSHRHFASLARRLGRIFAHAYYSHREIFEQAEAESSLYARFLALTSKFDLVPSEFLVIPSGQYGGEGDKDGRDGQDGHDHYHPHQQLLEPPVPRASVSPKIPQQQLGAGRPRSPLISASSDPSISIGGIGEHPTTGSGSRSRFGRNRTDTMVFADIEFSAVVDELAAKARAGEFDANYEIEAPKSARLITETIPREPPREEGPEDVDLESEADFEISLKIPELDDVSTGGLTTESTAEVESPIPSPEEESGVLAAGSIGSATMDEHVQATISEDLDEPDLSQAGVPGADAESPLTEISSGVELPSDEPETVATVVSLSNTPSLPDPGDFPDVENELVAEPAVVESSSDHAAQADSEDEGETSTTTPELSDAQETQTTVSE